MVWPLLIAGAGMAAAGSAATYAGARQSQRAQQSVFDEELDEQNKLDAEAQRRLEQYLEENAPQQQIEETSDRQGEEQTALNQVAETVTGAAEKSAAGGANSAQGQIATAGQGIRASAARRVAPVTRVQAVNKQALANDERLRDYMLDRNRIGVRAQGRSRLLPYRMNAAGMRGGEMKAVGAGASALGQLLLMYGMSPAPTTPGAPV